MFNHKLEVDKLDDDFKTECSFEFYSKQRKSAMTHSEKRTHWIKEGSIGLGGIFFKCIFILCAYFINNFFGININTRTPLLKGTNLTKVSTCTCIIKDH